MNTYRFLAASALAFTLSVPLCAQAVVIDDFADDQAEISVSPTGPTAAGSSVPGSMIGGSRDIGLSIDPGPSALTAEAGVASGFGQVSNAATTAATALFQWDGGDNSIVLDSGGLGSVDLTDGGASNSIEIGVAFADLPATLTFEVYSGGGGFSSFTVPTVPGTGLIVGAASIFLLFDAFSGNADFTDVGAMQLVIEDFFGGGLDIALDYVQTAEAVPLPAAAWLFLSALAGLGAFRRRG